MVKLRNGWLTVGIHRKLQTVYGHVASLESIHRTCFNCWTSVHNGSLTTGNPQEVANDVWACGKLGINSPNLFRLLDEHVELLVDNRNPQDIGNCVWACGKLVKSVSIAGQAQNGWLTEGINRKLQTVHGFVASLE